MPKISNPTVLIISQVSSKQEYYGPNKHQAKVEKVCVSVNSPADQLIEVICYDASVRKNNIEPQIYQIKTSAARSSSSRSSRSSSGSIKCSGRSGVSGVDGVVHQL